MRHIISDEHVLATMKIKAKVKLIIEFLDNFMGKDHSTTSAALATVLILMCRAAKIDATEFVEMIESNLEELNEERVIH